MIDLLAGHGAEPIVVPTIAVAPPADGGDALRKELSELAAIDWVVVSSANGARVLADALDGRSMTARIAAVGPRTAAVAAEVGLVPDLVPARFAGEGIVEAFAELESRGRVLIVRPEVARDVVAEGLRAQGWSVEQVVAYRTVTASVTNEQRAAAAAATVATFTSPLTFAGYLDAVAPTLPSIVATIGPVTSAAVRDRGFAVDVEADPYTVDALVEALVDHLDPTEREAGGGL